LLHTKACPYPTQIKVLDEQLLKTGQTTDAVAARLHEALCQRRNPLELFGPPRSTCSAMANRYKDVDLTAFSQAI